MLCDVRYAVLGLATVMLLTTSCVEERALYISQAQAPTAGCVINTDATKYLPDGMLDVSAGMGYWLYPLVRNDLPSSITIDPTQPERNILTLTEFKVSLDMSDVPGSFAPAMLNFNRRISSVALKPGGKLAARVQIMTDELARTLAGGGMGPGDRRTVIATLVLKTKRLGSGSVLESAPFTFPFTVCNGCLVNKLDGPCPADPTSLTVLASTCGLPQDQPVTCCGSTLPLTCFAGQAKK